MSKPRLFFLNVRKIINFWFNFNRSNFTLSDLNENSHNCSLLAMCWNKAILTLAKFFKMAY